MPHAIIVRGLLMRRLSSYSRRLGSSDGLVSYRRNRLLGVPQITVAVYDDLYIVRLVDDALLEPFLDDILQRDPITDQRSGVHTAIGQELDGFRDQAPGIQYPDELPLVQYQVIDVKGGWLFKDTDLHDAALSPSALERHRQRL